MTHVSALCECVSIDGAQFKYCDLRFFNFTSRYTYSRTYSFSFDLLTLHGLAVCNPLLSFLVRLANFRS